MYEWNTTRANKRKYLNMFREVRKRFMEKVIFELGSLCKKERQGKKL